MKGMMLKIVKALHPDNSEDANRKDSNRMNSSGSQWKIMIVLSHNYLLTGKLTED
jgi:molybdopterin-guanine dinucleotide biosynthesis protein